MSEREERLKLGMLVLGFLMLTVFMYLNGVRLS